MEEPYVSFNESILLKQKGFAWTKLLKMGMEEAYVSLNVAKLLKLKGFDWECHHFYYCRNNGEILERYMQFIANRNSNRWKNQYAEYVSAPTLQMAISWLWETYNINIAVQFINESGKLVYNISHPTIKFDDILSHPMFFDCYEEAVNAALENSLIKLIYDAGRILK